MIDGKQLLDDLQPLRKYLEDDLRERSEQVPALAERLKAEWQAARQRERTAQTYEAWREDTLAQAAVMWLLLRALDVDPSATLVLGLISLPILVGMLSPVPGGAGIREALMLGVARVHNADSAAVLLAALTYRIALFASIPVLYAGVRFWISRSPQPVLPVTEQLDTGR